jgi:Carboxypeptidase regulatory-like domain/TonB dependent receptor
MREQEAGNLLRLNQGVFKHFVRMAGLILVLAMLAGVRVSAQSNSSVTGVVTDATGAVVVGADVDLTNIGDGFARATKTNDAGVYEFLQVPPGTDYTLTFSKAGFRTFNLDKVTLSVSSKETRDAQLQVGDTKTTVEVKANTAETLNTTDASIGTVINGDRIQDLPNTLVNNASNYLSLAPGVTPGGAVTGTRSDQTNITLDGLDVNDQRGGFAFTPAVNLPLDSIQELRVTVAGDDATFGHSSGGQLELVTKGGTNKFHGAAFDLNRVTAYTANDYFNNLNGVPNPKLIRNQFFGNLGGPIIKDKLFFFFSYDGLRAVQSQQITQTVPDPSFFNGQLNYINSSGGLSITPTGDATVQNSLANLDPQGIGADTDLLGFMQTRGYAGNANIPAPNTNSAGDGINTSGYFFVAPVHSKDNTMIGRLDYQVTKNHRLFFKGTWDKSSDDDNANHIIEVFPGDPTPGASIIDHSRSVVGGDTWTISPTITNQVSFGLTDQVIGFVVNYKPTLPDNFNFDDPFYGDVFSAPYLGLNEQFPVVPVYQLRDTLTWTRGKHTFQFGGTISPTIFKSGNLTDTNNYGIGVGGDLTGLSNLTGCSNAPHDDCLPNNFGGDPGEWARVFTAALGRFQGVSAGYNYDTGGNALPQGQLSERDYHSTQYEFFAQDSYNVRSDLTVTAGVRWNFHQPLQEVNGFEVVPNLGPNDIFPLRLTQAAEGISGPNAVPFITYGLGGSANKGPGYYKPSYTNFAPRVGIAYSPAATQGFLGKLLGNRQSSIRAGFGLDYDNNLIGQGFELDELSFLFSSTVPENFGNLQTDPRFTCPAPCSASTLVANLPMPLSGGTTPRPTFTPNIDSNGFPIGFTNGGFGVGPFFNFDPHFKTPYNMSFSLGIQRELPGDWLLQATYFGKLGRRLTALGDPAQTLNFKDATSGQYLYDAFGAVQKQVQQGTGVSGLTPQPWFENQVNAALSQTFGPGTTCQEVTATSPNSGGISCTQIAYYLTSNGFYFGDGDVSSTIQSLADYTGFSGGNLEQGLLLPNVGLLAQDGAAGYIGNYSSSNYNALIVQVSHRISHSLTMDFNYTYSHSIDNDSGVQNNLISFAGSEICDLRNLRVCRGSSDFDHRHIITANFDYGLPFGHGKWLGANWSKPLDEAFGGWRFTGIFSAHSGSPFKIDSGAFTIDFTQTQPEVFIGTKADVAGSIHQVPSGQSGVAPSVQYFSNLTNAENAFTAPIAGGPGNRNVVFGPGLWDLDLALLKDFTMPWSDNQKLQFRAETINVFNHTNFDNPGANSLNFGTFGDITGDAGPRILQLGLKFSF